MNLNVKSPQVHEHLYALIQRHNYLIKLAKKLADTISFVLLTQLLISSILLCIMGKYIVSISIDFYVSAVYIYKIYIIIIEIYYT